ncbi:hypothetical protein [Pedobacter sp. Leaf176]|uniref:hypothetical protein n=1 Tax=Pedobacter sp. Leaf176 TaxID=1736286 RepID=UPI0006F35540|nr:hypothetical protein [Pedobacter sp. Leaf176]KQR70884.1 hypothetical protein ASF92_05615 [Pedobacter sp. Leaf176]
MLKNLDYKKKNSLLIAAMLVLGYLAWNFSFRQAVSAFRLNSSLKKEQAGSGEMDSAFPAISRKHNFYTSVIKSYHIKSEDYEGHLWQSLSGMAMGKGLEINFSPELTAQTDTTLTKLHILKQYYHFKGNYPQMARLLDSISKTNGIGRTSGFEIKRDKKQGTEPDGKLTMKLELSGILH